MKLKTFIQESLSNNTNSVSSKVDKLNRVTKKSKLDLEYLSESFNIDDKYVVNYGNKAPFKNFNVDKSVINIDGETVTVYSTMFKKQIVFKLFLSVWNTNVTEISSQTSADAGRTFDIKEKVSGSQFGSLKDIMVISMQLINTFVPNNEIIYFKGDSPKLKSVYNIIPRNKNVIAYFEKHGYTYSCDLSVDGTAVFMKMSATEKAKGIVSSVISKFKN